MQMQTKKDSPNKSVLADGLKIALFKDDFQPVLRGLGTLMFVSLTR